jgi:hypothetical protein
MCCWHGIPFFLKRPAFRQDYVKLLNEGKRKTAFFMLREFLHVVSLYETILYDALQPLKHE